MPKFGCPDTRYATTPTVVTKDLLLAILRGEIGEPERFAAWLATIRHDGILPTRIIHPEDRPRHEQRGTRAVPEKARLPQSALLTECRLLTRYALPLPPKSSHANI